MGEPRDGDLLAAPRIRRWTFTAPQVTFLGGFVVPLPWRAIVWTGSLVVIGTACVLNARRCGRLHCYFTGPFFLFAALVVSGHALGLIGPAPGGLTAVGLGIVAISTILNVVPERVWGRYRSGNGAG